VLGRPDEASQVIDDLDRRLRGPLPSWMKQAWLLWKADLLLCAGRSEDASKTAEEAFADMGIRLYSPALAGPFARWLAHTGKSGPNYSAARSAVESMLESLSDFDSLDQVEVICAALTLGLQNETQQSVSEHAIEKRLHDLPYEVVNHLRRVGSLP
jgi:hypothetical protein